MFKRSKPPAKKSPPSAARRPKAPPPSSPRQPAPAARLQARRNKALKAAGRSRLRPWLLAVSLPLMALLCNGALVLMQQGQFSQGGALLSQLPGIESLVNPIDASTPAIPQAISPQRSAAVATPLASSEVGALDAIADQSTHEMAELFNLSVRTLVIDPGHGGRDPGAIGSKGLQEKDITLQVAKRLRTILEQTTDLNIVLTREVDKRVTLRERAKIAKQVQGDLFLSIHFNTLPQPEANLVETYYFGAQSDKKSLSVAQRENAANSGVGMGEFKQLLEKMNNRLKHSESKRFAQAVQYAVHSNLSRNNPELRDAGIKTAPFMVLLANDAPAILAEIVCLSHPDEEARLRVGAYQQQIAQALALGVQAYLKTRAQPPQAALLSAGVNP